MKQQVEPEILWLSHISGDPEAINITDGLDAGVYIAMGRGQYVRASVILVPPDDVCDSPKCFCRDLGRVFEMAQGLIKHSVHDCSVAISPRRGLAMLNRGKKKERVKPVAMEVR